MNEQLKEKELEIVNRTGTYILNVQLVCELINKSPSTLERWRKQGKYLEYKKGPARNSPIEYPAHTIAEYILSNSVKVYKGGVNV